MVEHGAVERLGRGRQASRCATVGIARPTIAAGMIMGENDPSTAELGGIGDDRAKWKIGAGFIAFMTS